MSSFDFIKATVLCEKVQKRISVKSEKKSFYSRLRLFMNGYLGAITPRELDLVIEEYNEMDKNCRAKLTEAQNKII